MNNIDRDEPWQLALIPVLVYVAAGEAVAVGARRMAPVDADAQQVLMMKLGSLKLQTFAGMGERRNSLSLPGVAWAEP